LCSILVRSSMFLLDLGSPCFSGPASTAAGQVRGAGSVLSMRFLHHPVSFLCGQISKHPLASSLRVSVSSFHCRPRLPLLIFCFVRPACNWCAPQLVSCASVWIQRHRPDSMFNPMIEFCPQFFFF
jgi:hypothetical protein